MPNEDSDSARIRGARKLRDLLTRRHRLEMAHRWYPDPDTRAEIEALDVEIGIAQKAVNES
jgi:hypothetical protein